MAATQTTNLGLNKPARQDFVSVVTDINDNMDILDEVIGAVPEGKSVQEQIDNINENLIDDTAGEGDTDKVWSADKTYNAVMGIFNHATEYTPSNSPRFYYGTWYHEVGTSYVARLNEGYAPTKPEGVVSWKISGNVPYHIPSSSDSNWLVYTISDVAKHINDFQSNIADVFYSGLVYKEGHYVSYNGVIYKRKSWGNITPVAKAWDASDWEKAEVANELAPKSNPIFTGSISLGRSGNTGSNSSAVGHDVTASGDYSHAEGEGTTALGNHQHVSGKFNVTDSTSLEIIGNGTANNARKNARLLDSSGNEKLKGDIYVNCNDDSTGGYKVISENAIATTAETQAMIDDYYGGGDE